MTIDERTWEWIGALKEERRYWIKEAAKDIVGEVVGAGSWPIIGYGAGYLYALAHNDPGAAQECAAVGSACFGAFAIIGTLCGLVDDSIGMYARDAIEQIKGINEAIGECEMR